MMVRGSKKQLEDMKSGVYQIRNTTTGKCYIGSSVDVLFRWRAHQRELRGQYHHNPHLQHAWNKYGALKFEFSVILYCDPDRCMTYEQVALDYYKPAYNARPDARGATYGCKNPVRFEGVNNPFYGRKHTDEAITRMKLAKRGERHNRTRLTWNDVRAIRSSTKKQKELAIEYGITQTAISKIITRRTWRE